MTLWMNSMLHGKTFNLRTDQFAQELWAQHQVFTGYKLDLATTILLQPVELDTHRYTLVIDWCKGAFLTQASAVGLMKQVTEQHPTMTSLYMRLAHLYAGNQAYLPFVHGHFGLVPLGGPSDWRTGWVSFYNLIALEDQGNAVALVFDNSLKLLLSTTLYFIRSRLADAMQIVQIQKDYLSTMMAESGFEVARPRLENSLTNVINFHPELVVTDPKDFHDMAIETLMVAAVEDYMLTGYADALQLTPAELTDEIKTFIYGHGRRIMPKARHFMAHGQAPTEPRSVEKLEALIWKNVPGFKEASRTYAVQKQGQWLRTDEQRTLVESAITTYPKEKAFTGGESNEFNDTTSI
ncbi:hypothetical protein [Furfurilactobacillus curtus]|uniref:Uncharacterized protein n=1 Tax=Furfurilactobacillus curtus TaxID=1746200 RepID=A0ABQ5JQF1_9LACO